MKKRIETKRKRTEQELKKKKIEKELKKSPNRKGKQMFIQKTDIKVQIIYKK